jgi:hypothetical protein
LQSQETAGLVQVPAQLVRGQGFMMQVDEKQVLEIQPDFGVVAAGVRAALAGGGRQFFKPIVQETALMGEPIGTPPRRRHANRPLRQAATERVLGRVPEFLRRPRHGHIPKP